MWRANTARIGISEMWLRFLCRFLLPRFMYSSHIHSHDLILSRKCVTIYCSRTTVGNVHPLMRKITFKWNSGKKIPFHSTTWRCAGKGNHSHFAKEISIAAQTHMHCTRSKCYLHMQNASHYSFSSSLMQTGARTLDWKTGNEFIWFLEYSGILSIFFSHVKEKKLFDFNSNFKSQCQIRRTYVPWKMHAFSIEEICIAFISPSFCRFFRVFRSSWNAQFGQTLNVLLFQIQMIFVKVRDDLLSLHIFFFAEFMYDIRLDRISYSIWMEFVHVRLENVYSSVIYSLLTAKAWIANPNLNFHFPYFNIAKPFSRNALYFVQDPLWPLHVAILRAILIRAARVTLPCNVFHAHTHIMVLNILTYLGHQPQQWVYAGQHNIWRGT